MKARKRLKKKLKTTRMADMKAGDVGIIVGTLGNNTSALGKLVKRGDGSLINLWVILNGSSHYNKEASVYHRVILLDNNDVFPSQEELKALLGVNG